MIKLSVYHRPRKRWPKLSCLVNTGAFYSGWTGAEPFGTIFIYRYYGYQVNCSACIKTRKHFFQRFEDAVFDAHDQGFGDRRAAVLQAARSHGSPNCWKCTASLGSISIRMPGSNVHEIGLRWGNEHEG